MKKIRRLLSAALAVLLAAGAVIPLSGAETVKEGQEYRIFGSDFRLTEDGELAGPELLTNIPLRYNGAYPEELLRKRCSACAEPYQDETGDYELWWEDLFSAALIVSDSAKGDEDSEFRRVEGPSVSILSDELTDGLEVTDCRISQSNVMLILERPDASRFLRIIEWENEQYRFTDSTDLPDYIRIARRYNGTSWGDLACHGDDYFIRLSRGGGMDWHIMEIDECRIGKLFLCDGLKRFNHGSFLFCDHDLRVPITEVEWDGFREKTLETFAAADTSGWRAVTQEKGMPVPVWEEPSVSSAMVCQLLNEVPVRLVSQEGDWAKIRLEDTVTGYIPAANLMPQPDEEYFGLGWGWPNFGRDFRENGVVYEKPDRESTILCENPEGFAWIIGVYRSFEWYLVMTLDGQVGYVRYGDTFPGNG